MTRVKRGTISLKRRRNILKQVKGYRFGRSKKERLAKEAIAHAGKHAFGHRRKKKREFRALWQIKINAGARNNGVSYSRLMGALKKKNIGLNRKMLAEIAERDEVIFKTIVAEAMR
ncbi:MAG: 50S ribosomal protein L20 [Patescibacteria group bacterium]